MSYQNTTKYSSWPPSLNLYYFERKPVKYNWRSKLLWKIKNTDCFKFLCGCQFDVSIFVIKKDGRKEIFIHFHAKTA